MPRPNLSKLSRSGKNKETISKFFTKKNDLENRACAAGERDQLSHVSSVNDDGDNSINTVPETSGSPISSGLTCTEGVSIIKDGEESSKRSAESQEGKDVKRQKTSSLNVASLGKSTVEKLNLFTFESQGNGQHSHSQKTTNPAKISSSLQEKLTNRNEAKHAKTKISSFKVNAPPRESSSSLEAKSSNVKTSKAGIKLTPLEQQFVAIKEKYPDAILLVECGYKYRFFGDDAEVAAKELNIYAHPDHNFMTASIPVIRLFVHVRRLVAKGYKVGVVKQMETAALKAAGDNKSGPFTRELSALYTKSTLIGEDVDSLNACETTESSLGGHLMCIYEDTSQDNIHVIAVMAVHPTTGDIVYDCFEDNSLREQLETRISHIQPVEILLLDTLSEKTEHLVKNLTAISTTEDDRIRIQRLQDTNFSYDKISSDLDLILQSGSGASVFKSDVSSIKKLPKQVLSCFYALWIYLKDFNLHKLLTSAGEMKKFSLAEHYLQLNGITQRNLEIFYNLSDHKVKGSLLWVMDHCRTPPGRRLLRNWIARPLKDHREINARLDAVTELINPSESVLLKMLEILPTIPDIERGLAAIFHKKCSPMDFWKICDSLQRIHAVLICHKASISSEVTSDLLRSMFLDLMEYLGSAKQWFSRINASAAKEGDKTNVFSSLDDFPVMKKCQEEIASQLDDIHQHRREIRLTLKSPALEYATVLGTEFLIEVKNDLLHLVPNDWLKINSTKAVSRYHSPFILESIKKLNQLKEQLILEANDTWWRFLEQFEEEAYPYFRKGAGLLAEFDCLVSLSRVACFEGYCRPCISEEEMKLSIKQGRHPVVEMLISKQEQFVPNATELSGDQERAMIITGPNMGGKSSYIKQVAIICIMAHIGSYIPADSATIPILNSIHTRMGASDDLFHGRSTFMVELQEAAQTLSAATKRSLVVLDELGRGTATHDGMAIAYATLKYLISKVKCLTLFVTHYPLLAELESVYPGNVINCHMAFIGSDEDGKGDTVTFLYSLQRGIADRSFGMNVARLACIPPDIITTAAEKSQELQKIIDRRLYQRKLCRELLNADENNIKELIIETYDL